MGKMTASYQIFSLIVSCSSPSLFALPLFLNRSLFDFLPSRCILALLCRKFGEYWSICRRFFLTDDSKYLSSTRFCSYHSHSRSYGEFLPHFKQRLRRTGRGTEETFNAWTDLFHIYRLTCSVCGNTLKKGHIGEKKSTLSSIICQPARE